MLAKFRAAKEAEIQALRDAAEKGLLPEPRPACQRPAFGDSLRLAGGIAIIAEYKRASPSLGVIRTDLEIEDVAREYTDGGAAAISVLTEEIFFDGRLAYLDRARAVCSLPLLRKDFIFDELQVKATAATQASAILLIARMLANAKELRGMRELAESCNLEAVIEIFDSHDLEVARDAGAKIIQANARDLQKLQVDTESPIQLIEAAKPARNEIWVVASGINNSAQLRRAREAGYQAALIGGFLMAKGAPSSNLKSLLGMNK